MIYRDGKISVDTNDIVGITWYDNTITIVECETTKSATYDTIEESFSVYETLVKEIDKEYEI